MAEDGDLRQIISDSGLQAVAQALRQRRNAIIQSWIQRVAEEPFHLGRPDRAVADHIPRLLDAVIDNLIAASQRREPLGLDEPELREAASEHARARMLQGLWVDEVITELRLLLREVSVTLRGNLDIEALDVKDVLGAELVVHDIVFGAAVIAAQILGAATRQQQTYSASLIVHDLRTPLTSLKGFAQLLSRQPESERVAHAAGVMLSQIDRLTAWIDDFLSSGQTTADLTAVTLSRTDLEQLVQKVISAMGQEARQRIVVTVDPGTDATGDWDEVKLQRVIENLLANALKFASAGEIAVSIRDGDGDRITLEVRDQGLGISTEERAKVFQPFYRSAEAIEQKVQGTGLGLFVAAGIVQAHGGTLTLDSPGLGQGTTVTMNLPRQLDDAPPKGESPMRDNRSARTRPPETDLRPRSPEGGGRPDAP